MKHWCWECDKETEFIRFQEIQTKEVREEKFEVFVDGEKCSECGDYSYYNEPYRDLTRQYREKHGLLSGVEIKSIRGSLNLTNDEFAQMVNDRGGDIGMSTFMTWHENKLDYMESDLYPQSVKEDKIIREIARSIKR